MIISLLLILGLHAICVAMMDTLAFRFKKSIFKDWNQTFWYPNKSWKNKFQEGQTQTEKPKFFGALDIFSYFTEGFGLLRLTSMILLALSFFVICLSFVNNSQTTTLNLILTYPILFVEWSLVYRVFYYKIFRYNE